MSLVLGCTCDSQLSGGRLLLPGVLYPPVHAQRLDRMHCSLAGVGGGLGNHKGLHSAILPLHHTHADGHPVGALLTPAAYTMLPEMAVPGFLRPAPQSNL